MNRLVKQSKRGPRAMRGPLLRQVPFSFTLAPTPNVLTIKSQL